MVELDIKLTTADLYDYNLKHSYSNPANIIATVLGIFGAAYGFWKPYWPLAAVGILLAIYLPFMLLLRSRQTITLNKSLSSPMHYVLDETGLTITQKEATDHCDWENMVKAVSTTRSLLLYTSRINATIIPKNQVGDALPLIIQTISANMPPEKVKIKC